MMPMKKTFTVLALSLLLLAGYAAQPQLHDSKPEIDLTPGTRAISDSEREMFEYLKSSTNHTATQVNDPTRFPAMTPEDEATWRAMDYYILNQQKFLENPELNRLVACSTTNPEVAFFVGRLQNGEYRSALIYPQDNGERTILSALNYEDMLQKLEKRMSEWNCRDYKIVRIKRRVYYVFDAAGTIHLTNTSDQEVTCAKIVELLQSKW